MFQIYGKMFYYGTAMFVLQFALIKKFADIPMHFIGQRYDLTSNFCSSRFNNCDGLSQYFIIF